MARLTMLVLALCAACVKLPIVEVPPDTYAEWRESGYDEGRSKAVHTYGNPSARRGLPVRSYTFIDPDTRKVYRVDEWGPAP